MIFSKDFHGRKYFWIFVKERKVLEKFLACMSVLKIQICSGKIEKVEKIKMVKVNMRYIPIYLRQGLVVLSLTTGTFLLLWSPLFGSSWRIGRGWTCDITPHLFVTCSLWLCGRRFFRLGFRCTPKWTPVVILLDHELLLLPVEEFKEYVVAPMRNWTSPDPTSILAFILLRKGCPRMRSKPKSPSLLRMTKSARTKQFLIRT